VTERKCTRITDARVWNSVREKDKENERERYGRRMLQDIRAEAGYKKQDSSRRPSGSEREREMIGRKNQRVGRGGKMRKRDRGTLGETGEKRTQWAVRGREERTREWSEIVQLSASERKRVGAMCVGHVERACVLGSPVCLSLSLCLPPFSTIRPPCLSANVILWLSLSSLSSSLSLSVSTSPSLLLSVEPRRVNTSAQDTLHSAPLSGGQTSLSANQKAS